MNPWRSFLLSCRVVKRSYSTLISQRELALKIRNGSRCFSTQGQNVITSPYPNVTIPNITLVDLVWDMVDKFPDYPALVCGITGRGYTYAESRVIARRFAASLHKAGFRSGDVLALALYNCPEFHLVLLGAIEAGMIVTTINPEYTPEEMRRQLLDSGAKCIVTTPESYPSVSKAVIETEPAVKSKIPIIVTPGLTNTGLPQGAIDFREMTHKDIDTSNLSSVKEANPDDIAVMPYSSGTTGLPKGVKLSHRNLITNCLQMCLTPQLWIVDPATSEMQEVVLGVLPFFHVYGLSCVLLSSLHFGAKVVTLPQFKPDVYLSTLVKHKATVLYLVPPLVQFLGAHPNVTGPHFNTVRFVTSGAGPIGQSDAQRVLDKANHINFIQGYGLTETSPLVSILSRESKNLSSSGVPIPNTSVKIIKLESGESVGPGVVGEICVHGPQVMVEYHNNPKATAETKDSEGWLHTGDMGYYDEHKHLFIVDRLKELIKVKGFQVAPAELEEILRQHPAVGDVAVIGVPHERSGEVPKAFIVPKDSKVKEDEIKKFVADKVSDYKQLAGGVQFVSTIPKNTSGKILRRKLKEMYCTQ
ncbi:uncharacterized protein [Periplaneta americana]